jgi:benzaldehyde dehydrogenase (NAD)
VQHNVLLRIAGKETAAMDGRVFGRRNPVSGKLVSEVAAASVEDAVRAADAAALAQAGWADLGPNARRQYLSKAADVLLAKTDDFIAAMTDEIGATEAWARFNIKLAAGILQEAAALTTQVTGEVIPSDKPGRLAMGIREPAGVVLGIAPWNAPIILGTRAIATPLACGNAVILKASEICPRTHSLIIETLEEAGIPEGVVNLVTNAPEDAGDVVGALIDHPAVRRINFTGSTAVGRIIAMRAARHLKPVLLELGGKAPLIVLEDADIDEAVKAAAFSAFFNQGQICMSAERIIVMEAIADEFVRKFADKATQLVAGDPRSAGTPLGAVIDLKTTKTLNALIDDAVSKGGTVLSGGSADNVLISATVVDHVKSNMRLYSEESFGPIVAIIRVKNEEDAVRVANDTEYGLSAAIFTGDAARGLRVARKIRSGICHINGPTVQDEAQMPFGGTKASGYGRFGGKAGIAEFTELRWITIETQPGHFPI